MKPSVLFHSLWWVVIVDLPSPAFGAFELRFQMDGLFTCCFFTVHGVLSSWGLGLLSTRKEFSSPMSSVISFGGMGSGEFLWELVKTVPQIQMKEPFTATIVMAGHFSLQASYFPNLSFASCIRGVIGCDVTFASL